MPDTRQPLYLIARGDDAGSSRSANRAIAEAATHGLLRNASVMACAPELEDAFACLGQLPGLCVGLHATLNCEWVRPRWGSVLPAAQLPSVLEPDGSFPASPLLLHDRRAAVAEMIAELEAQLQRLRRVGFTVDYLDQHMGIGWLPGLRPALADLCRREGLIDAEAEFPQRLPQPAGSDSLLAKVLAGLAKAAPGFYVQVTHPTSDDPEMAAFTLVGAPERRIGGERNGDRLLWLVPELRAACHTHGVTIVTYRQALALKQAVAS